MFLTFDHAQIPPGALIRGGRTWRYVEYLSSFPYFHVAVLDLDEDMGRPTVLLINTVHDLLELIQEARGWQIQEIQLVSSGQINGQGQWLMERLSSIQTAVLGSRNTYSYTVKSGNVYFERPEAKRYYSDAWMTVYSVAED